MSVESITRHPEHDREDRRRIRNAISVSIGFHLAVVAVLLISPPIVFHPPPRAITVEWIELPEPLPATPPRPVVDPRLRPAAPAPVPAPAPGRSHHAPRRRIASPSPAPDSATKPEEAKPPEPPDAALPPKFSTASVRVSAHGFGVATSNHDSVESDGDALEDQFGNTGTGDLLAADSPRPADRRVAPPPVAAKRGPGPASTPRMRRGDGRCGRGSGASGGRYRNITGARS